MPSYVFAQNAPSAEYDRSLAWAALLLAAAGLVMVYSASIATAGASRFTGHNSAYFLLRQAVFLGVALLAATRRVPGPGALVAEDRAVAVPVLACWCSFSCWCRASAAR